MSNKNMFEKLGSLEERKYRVEVEMGRLQEFKNELQGYVDSLNAEIIVIRKQINRSAKRFAKN